MKISEHFHIEEFVPQNVFKTWQIKSLWFIDRRIIVLAEFIRRRFDKEVTINNRFEGGVYDQSGFRLPSTNVGAVLSQHKFGRAIDIKIPDLGDDFAEIVRDDIRNNFDEYNKNHLTTIESDTPSWVHCDIRETLLNKLFIVNP